MDHFYFGGPDPFHDTYVGQFVREKLFTGIQDIIFDNVIYQRNLRFNFFQILFKIGIKDGIRNSGLERLLDCDDTYRADLIQINK